MRASSQVARVSGARAFHASGTRAAAINFQSVVAKVSGDADKSRLMNLQKIHEGAKGELMGVKGSAEAIDWAAWSSSISDSAVVDEIKKAYESVSLPKDSETELVSHPAWDNAEFEKLSASLELENEASSAEIKKLGGYMKYLDNLPPVSEMTVEDVLGNNADLDYKIQRQMNELELHNVDTPERSVAYTAPDPDVRKRPDPIFPDSELVDHVNAPARALAADVLADPAMAAAVGKLFPDGEEAAAFGLAVEGLLCQAPLVDGAAEHPVLDFAASPAGLAAVFDAKFPDVTEEAQADVSAVFSGLIEEAVLGAAKAAAAAKESAVSAAASDILASAPKLAGSTAVFGGADAAKWAPLAAKLLNVQSGADELLAGTELAGDFAAFVGKPTATGARSLAAAYSVANDDVEQVGAMVELLEAHVIQNTLYTDTKLKASLGAVFGSEAEQAAAYKKWWPQADTDTANAVAVVSPFDNVAASAASDAAFVKVKTIVTKTLIAIE